VLLQWGRLRGALMAVVKASACPDLPHRAIEALIALIIAECEAITILCKAGPSSQSSIFNETIVSDEGLPAGAFVIVFAKLLDCGNLSESAQHDVYQAITKFSGPVFETLCLECPDFTSPSVIDPRPSLCEAWFLTMSSVAKTMQDNNGTKPLDDLLIKIVVDTCCAGIVLILNPSLEKDTLKREKEKKGMSMDGPQTLAIMSFLEEVFLCETRFLQYVAQELQQRLQGILPEQHQQDDNILCGMSILCAGLYRAASGGLPPWTLESTPSVFAALYQGCGNRNQAFRQVLEAATVVRISAEIHNPKGVSNSRLALAGRFFETMKEATRREFLQKAIEIADKDTADGWRRFKTVLKQAAGGKKKFTGLCQKPSPSSWECDRL